MTQKSYFFDSVDHDRIYTSADFARVFGAIAGRDGVIYGYGDELKVTPGSGMAVTVGTGAAFVQGRMLEVYDQAETLPIATADATNPRIDRVVIRVDLSTAQRKAYLAVKVGTPAATPAAPLLQQDATIWEMSLAQVRVAAGATGIVAGDITDEREFTSTAATTLYTPGVAGFDVATVQAGLDVLAGSRIVDHNLDVVDPPNGYYVRWENGLQVCVVRMAFVNLAEAEDKKITITQPHPATFATVRAIAPNANRPDSTHLAVVQASSSAANITISLWLAKTSGSPGAVFSPEAITLGTWK